MTLTRAVALGAAALLGTALLGACGQVATPTAGTPLQAGAAGDEPVVERFAGAAELATTVVPELGAVLTDGEGLTLYRFDGDTAKPPTATCAGACARTWPPALATSGDVEVQGVDQALVGTVDRADGTRQITVAGWPVYRFAEDTAPGQAGGQGVDGTWFVAAPDGGKALAPASGLALTTASAGALGTVLTDREGMTLYRFDEDSADPSTSTCGGDCAAAWPPLLVDTANFEVRGVDRSLVGTVTRADGTLQVTAAGWPLYLFSGDGLCGDAEGHGAGGVWFAAAPDGSKAG
ncbi:hypothetical protein CKY47_32185 [Saccharothrix yanglingensis]|uniref:Lipoprotein with Yx(FWY)xxD motif n=1 Tax=Saccharothrix yanglingensis TaxID=659496 RepID=A0ABU0X8R5_9PSEU|nr:hypothetical protein [Saccharothrix yanglingensis]